MNKAFFARIRGRVQGVGFRYSVVREAYRLGITGWVRNTADGGVELWAEGTGERLAALFRWLQKGPPGSRVESAEKTGREPVGCAGFNVEY